MFLALAGAAILAVACSSPERLESAPLPSPPATVDSQTSPGAAAPVTPNPAATATTAATATPSPTMAPTPTATPSPSPSPTSTPEPTTTPTPEPPTLQIVELTMNDLDDSPLRFLSIDEHPHFGGFTLVHGTIAIEGEGELADVVLEIVEYSTGIVVEAGLAALVREQLLQPLDEAGRVEIAASQLLFEIPSTAFAPFDTSENGLLQLRVRARATDGREAVYEVRDILFPKLVRYTGENRYFVGEEDQGGNSWVTPDVRTLLEQLDGIEIGDISNMNGGPFPPHVSHQRGVDVDIWFEGYNELDGEAARFMLDLLDQPGIIERVELAFVSYEQTDDDPFWIEIRDVVLHDGRLASAVFLPEPDHTGHFHLRLYR